MADRYLDLYADDTNGDNKNNDHDDTEIHDSDVEFIDDASYDNDINYNDIDRLIEIEDEFNEYDGMDGEDQYEDNPSPVIQPSTPKRQRIDEPVRPLTRTEIMQQRYEESKSYGDMYMTNNDDGIQHNIEEEVDEILQSFDNPSQPNDENYDDIELSILDWPIFSELNGFVSIDTEKLNDAEFWSILKSSSRKSIENYIIEALDWSNPVGNGIDELKGELLDEMQIIQPNHIGSLTFRMFPVKSDMLSYDLLMRYYRTRISALQFSYEKRVKTDGKSITSARSLRYMSALSKVACRIQCCYDMIVRTYTCMGTFSVAYSDKLKPLEHLMIGNQSYDDLSVFQIALIEALKYAREREYYKRDDSIYARKIVNGEYVHFYTYQSTMSEFVYGFSENMVSQHWSAFTTRPDIIKKVVDHLTNGTHTHLPELKPDRSKFATRNGVYDISTETFKLHRDVGDHVVCVNYFDVDLDWDAICSFVNDGVRPSPFYRYGFDPRSKNKPPEDEWDYGDDWFHMPYETAFTKVINTQWRDDDEAPENTLVKDAELVKRFFWVGIGRLLYKTKELDNFQLQMTIVGESGVGKSIIIMSALNIYPTEFVEVLSSAMEQKYGTANLDRVFLYGFDEVEDHFGFYESDWLQLVSGGRLVKRQKYHTHENFTAECPGIMGANRLPAFKHYREAVARRLMLFTMKHKLRSNEKDGSLERRVEEEMIYIIIKANHAYRELMKIVGYDRSLDTVWPVYFKDNVEAFMYQNQPLMHWYFTDGNIVVRPDAIVPLDVIKQAFFEWAHNMGYRDAKWSPEAVNILFEKADILYIDKVVENGQVTEVKTAQHPSKPMERHYRNVNFNGIFIQGIDIRKLPFRISRKYPNMETIQYQFDMDDIDEQVLAQQMDVFETENLQPRLPEKSNFELGLEQKNDESPYPHIKLVTYREVKSRFNMNWRRSDMDVFVPKEKRKHVRKHDIPQLEVLLWDMKRHEDTDKYSVEEVEDVKDMIEQLKACSRHT